MQTDLGNCLCLLCFGGLIDVVPEPKIAEVLQQEIALDGKADALVEMAIQAGGHDNITVVLVDFVV